jgi:hypothetical protein
MDRQAPISPFPTKALQVLHVQLPGRRSIRGGAAEFSRRGKKALPMVI